MDRLIAAGLLPERAGQLVQAWVHVSLAELRAMDCGSVLQDEWITALHARWAAARATASVAGSESVLAPGFYGADQRGGLSVVRG